MTEQTSILRKLTKLGTRISYPRFTAKFEYELKVLVFYDASKVDKNGQVGILTSLLVGGLKHNAIHRVLSWVSHKSKRPGKSVTAAEILAAMPQRKELTK